MAFSVKGQFLKLMREMDEAALQKYRFAIPMDDINAEVVSDVKEPVSFYRKREHAMLKEVAQQKYEAMNLIKMTQIKQFHKAEPQFYNNAIGWEENRVALANSNNSSFQMLDSLYQRAYSSMDGTDQSAATNGTTEHAKENNRAHLHYLDSHRQGMLKRRSKTFQPRELQKKQAPLVRNSQQPMRAFKIHPLLNPLYFQLENGNYYPIPNTKENQVLIELANDRDLSNLNLWSKVQDVKRHYKRIKVRRKHQRIRDRQTHMMEILDRGGRNLTTDEDSQIDFNDKALFEDSESEDEETKRKQENKILEKVIGMRAVTKASKSKTEIGEAKESRQNTLLRSTINDHKTSVRVHTRDKNSNGLTDKDKKETDHSHVVARKNSNHLADSKQFANEIKRSSTFSKDFVNLEANDIVLDLPRGATFVGSEKALLETYKTPTDYSGSPALTRQLQKQQQKTKKIQELNKYRHMFEHSYVHSDSSNRLKLEKERGRPINKKHFVNIIDNPQLVRNQLADMKKFAKEVDSIMHGSLKNDETTASTIQQQHHNSLLLSIVENREKRNTSLLQMITERNIGRANHAHSRAEANYNSIKRRMQGREISDNVLTDILHSISLDVSKLV